MFSVIGAVISGLIVGVIAKFIMPGKDPGGFIVTVLLGIAGAFVRELRGSVSNVIGLPLAETLALLRDAGVRLRGKLFYSENDLRTHLVQVPGGLFDRRGVEAVTERPSYVGVARMGIDDPARQHREPRLEVCPRHVVEVEEDGRKAHWAIIPFEVEKPCEGRQPSQG